MERTALEITNALEVEMPTLKNMDEAIVILRQQHAEIERLSSINSALVKKSNAYLIENARLADGLLQHNEKITVDNWKETILDQIMLYGLYKAEYEFDPRAALKALIDWEVSVALDPAVSLEAQKLLYANPPTVPKEVLE